MWICSNCHQKREELETFADKHPYGNTYAEELWNDINCECGGELEPAFKCEICGEWFCEDDLHNGVCDRCIDGELTVENCLQYIKDNEYEEDYFVEWWTGAVISDGSSCLTDICSRNWESKYKSEIRTERPEAELSIVLFAKDDITDFADWLKGRSK